jgi:hypothetical protein
LKINYLFHIKFKTAKEPEVIAHAPMKNTDSMSIKKTLQLVLLLKLTVANSYEHSWLQAAKTAKPQTSTQCQQLHTCSYVTRKKRDFISS